jgi:WD40 repeat protein
MDHKSRNTIGRFHREGDPLAAIEFAPDGKSLFEGEYSGRITQWDVQTGAAVREFAAPDPAGPDASEHRREPIGTGPEMGLCQARLSPDGRVLARARNDGLIELWDVPSGRWIDWLDSGATRRARIDFSPDGRTLAAREDDKCVLWDVQARRVNRTIATGRGNPLARFSPDGAVIAQGVGGYIQFFDARTDSVLSENKELGTSGMGMVFHPGGLVFFASAFDSSIRLWDTRTGRELLSLRKHTALIVSLLLTPDGNTLISSDVLGTVLAWDLTYYNGHIRRELDRRAAPTEDP